ncbi:MAG: ArsA family ATPase [Candidatus Methanomethylophilus sp.]|nr:ArsA family ATPase [Methanomethylophilus sp.]
MRLIIYTGKGGVGKTSVSAATARRLAQKGHRTIIMSVDTAHSLGDSLNIKLGPVPKRIAPNLDAFELDILHEMQTKWSAIKDYLTAFMFSQGLESISAEEMAVFPGMEMVAALLYVLQFEDQGKYDAVVIDTAPTGETLRLMSFPDMSSWYIDKAFSFVNRMINVARATIGKVVDFPLPTKEVMDNLKELKDDMTRVKAVLDDTEHTTMRLVLIPERMAISETMRAYTYLSLYNKNVECLIVNKVLPPDVDGKFLQIKLKEQEAHMTEIHKAFEPLRIMSAQMLRTELRGTKKLDHLADMIFGDEDPIEVYASESPMKFVTVDGIDELCLKMPFVKEDQVELFKGNDNTIIIHVGSQKRTVLLPMTLAGADLLGAEFGDGCLIIKFRRKKV